MTRSVLRPGFTLFEANARVLDGDPQASRNLLRPYGYPTVSFLGGHSMFDGIFDQRLDGKNGNQRGSDRLADGQLRFQAIAQPQSLDLKVCLNDSKLFGQRNDCLMVPQKIAKDLSQIDYHAPRV